MDAKGEDMKEDIKLLHIYAQDHEHDGAWIVGSKEGLIALRDAIDQAIQTGVGWTPSGYESRGVMATDGEGYDVRVIQDNSGWGAPVSESKTVWDRLECPYVGGGPYQRLYRPDTLWPSDIWDWEAERIRMRELRDGEPVGDVEGMDNAVEQCTFCGHIEAAHIGRPGYKHGCATPDCRCAVYTSPENRRCYQQYMLDVKQPVTITARVLAGRIHALKSRKKDETAHTDEEFDGLSCPCVSIAMYYLGLRGDPAKEGVYWPDGKGGNDWEMQS